MEERIRRIYVPMTETGFYILFCLQTPKHGYAIGQQVKEMTGNEVLISPGTMYGTLGRVDTFLIGFFSSMIVLYLYLIVHCGRKLMKLREKYQKE